MIKRSIFILCLFATGSCYACAMQNTADDISQLNRILLTDPHKAAVDAIAARDLRFLALNRDPPEVPGVPEYFQRYVAIYGMRILPGTSGGPRDTRQAELVRKARDYALRYNRLLLEWLRQADTQSMRTPLQTQPGRCVCAPVQGLADCWRNNLQALHDGTFSGIG